MDLAGAVANLLELGLIAVPSAVLIEGTVGLADDLTPYDAAYVVLAEVRGSPLTTLDTGLARAAGSRGLDVLRPGTARFARWVGSRRSLR